MRIQQTIDFGYPEGYIYDGYRYVEGGESYLTPEGPVLVFLGTRSLVPCIALKKVEPFIWPEIIKPGTWACWDLSTKQYIFSTDEPKWMDVTEEDNGKWVFGIYATTACTCTALESIIGPLNIPKPGKHPFKVQKPL